MYTTNAKTHTILTCAYICIGEVPCSKVMTYDHMLTFCVSDSELVSAQIGSRLAHRKALGTVGSELALGTFSCAQP